MTTLYAGFGAMEQSELGEYLNGSVQEAARLITPYWPISTFIASNSLGNMEDLPFAEAMRHAHDLRGSQGYLPLPTYQQFYAQGRITNTELESVIAAMLTQEHLPHTVKVGEQAISTDQICKNWLLLAETPENTKLKYQAIWSKVFQQLEKLNLLDTPGQGGEETLGDKIRLKNGQTVTSLVNHQMIIWCAAFLDEGQAAWQMPGRKEGFYQAWKALAGLDKSLQPYIAQPVARKLAKLPNHAEEALIELLQELEIPKSAWANYLSRHFAQLPGWASLIKWREEHPEAIWQQKYPISLIEYLAVRVFYEALLIENSITAKESAGFWQKFSKPKAINTAPVSLTEKTHAEIIANLVTLITAQRLQPETISADAWEILGRLAKNCTSVNRQELWQAAYEKQYRNELMTKLAATPKSLAGLVAPKTPEVQAVFCIDVRSEGLRRHLERQGQYETFGFAGFFGVPMRYQPFASACQMTLGPALINSTQMVMIKEEPKDTTPELVEKRLAYNEKQLTWRSVKHGLKENLLTPFVFVEMTGWLSFFPLVGKTIAPKKWRKLNNSLQEKMRPTIPTQPSFISHPEEMSYAEQARAVKGMLMSIGLTKNFAPIVLVCGHGSDTENNPYASALDCGACGGNHGGNSAVVAVSILNTKAVRDLLAEEGIIIPDDTVFVAGEHNTTTDTVEFLNEEAIPTPHGRIFEQFKLNLAKAGERNAQERLAKLNEVTAKATKQVTQRASDWAQVRPEWGLVRNAAFICGKRELTANLNLDSRVFLHSYDQNQDTEGAVLEGILTAPVVVAEWINMQYYLSSVDNHNYGSGTKLLHTVVSQIGVMQGRESDLLVGLPKQSVMVGDELYHEPMRLTVIVEAPTARIKSIVAKHERLQYLTKNKWITLVSYDSKANRFYEYSADEEWLEVEFETGSIEADREERAA